MDKNATCLSKTEAFSHFFSARFSTAGTERNKIETVNKIPLLGCPVYLGFGWGKRRNFGFIDGWFCKNFHAGFLQQSNGEN